MGSGLRPGSLAATKQQDGRPPPTVSLPDLLQTQLQTMVGGLFGCLLLLVSTCSAWHDSYHDLAPEWPDYLDNFKAELRHPREEPGLQFPPLSAKQKQFALNPGHPEYYRERPDFLQFGLQALDDTSDPRQEAARESEKEALILEKQLEAVLDGLNQGDGVGDTKRAGGNASAGEESEPEGEEGEGDYTVYECPGLASTDEMEVKNPLFNDDPTPKNP